MSVPSASEQTLLDHPTHKTELYLSIYEPQIALACQVNGSYNSSTQTFSYDNITQGNFLNVAENDFQVALIGTSQGGDEKGRTWVRSASATQIKVVESDHIDWEDDLYVTILKFIEIVPVFPRIIQNPANELDVIFYKHFDVAYSSQNSDLGQFINMGCDYAGFRDPASGLCPIYYSASGTHDLRDRGLSYNWSFEGATVTGSTSHTPGYVNYDTAGHFQTVLETTVTGASITDRSIRYISIYDRPGHGDDTPILNWEFTEWSTSRDMGTQRLGIRVRESIPKTTIRDNALVIIFADEWFGSTKQNIGGNSLGRQSIKFVGYIEEGTIRTNYRDQSIEFTALSTTGIMQTSECFSVSVESKTSPSTWYELLNMDVRRAIYHYLRWHSTVLKRCDFEFVGTDHNIQYFDSDRESLYSSIDNLMVGALRGKIVSDKQGKLWAEREASILDNADTALGIALSITSKDWIEEPLIDEKYLSEVSFIEMGGIYYNPAGDSFNAYLASAPGVAPRYRGKVERIQGLALADQDDLNSIVGNMLAWENARYPNIDVRLRGNFSNLDVAPQEIIKMTITSDENNRGVSFTEKEFAIRGITWFYDSKKKLLLPQITLHEITQGFDGTTIIIPDVPPTEETPYGGGSFHIPPFQIPSLPAAITNNIHIYHNGIFVGIAHGLNFIDDNCTGSFT